MISRIMAKAALSLLAFACLSHRLSRASQVTTRDSLMRGYPLERHSVETKDSYILEIHRIPRGLLSPSPASTASRKLRINHRQGNASSPKTPVLLIHGISLSSTCWVVNEPDQSLGFILADRGYDVWMHNTRGNTFSRKHKTLTDTDSSYWDFSMDEMALLDLPAVIDYILDQTGAPKIQIVTHSQGSTLVFMLLASESLGPRYNSKVSLHVGLGPVAYVKLMTSTVMGAFCRTANLSNYVNTMPPQEHEFMTPTSKMACRASQTSPICIRLVERMFGSSMHIQDGQYKKMFKRWPSSTSFGDVMHWAQMYNEPTPRLAAYNYGPEYDLFKISSLTVVMAGGRDVMAPKSNIKLIEQNLKKSGALKETILTDSFGHMDYIWSISADGVKGAAELVYPAVLRALEIYR